MFKLDFLGGIYLDGNNRNFILSDIEEQKYI